jgi:Predicted membrane protein (DUF2079)
VTSTAREGDRAFWPTWLIVAVLTAALTAGSTYQALVRYHEFRSGWPWDLAYYNQWFWALTYGDREITVRPLSRYAEEGPSVWKMNYLAPIRFAIAPIYRLLPDPRTLLLIQNIMFWWVIPAAYTLVRSESGSRGLALSAAALVPLSPILWPLVWNDFRELQLAIPFVLWAIQGVRSRSKALAILGIAGMLACRQEFAVMAATFTLIPPREPESLTVALRWRHLILFVGASWFLFGFLGYLRFVVGRTAPENYVQQFLIPKAPLFAVIKTSCETLAYTLGAWAVLAFLAPRIAIIAIPWIWGPCSGEWSMEVLSTESWHHVRYLLPMTSLVLAAGLIGYARLGSWIFVRRRGWTWIALFWILQGATGAAGLMGMNDRLDRVPVAMDAHEAAAARRWIEQVDQQDGVLADYTVAAPLSSRPRLYSYVVNWNLPKSGAVRYPELDSGITWLFIRNDYALLKVLLDQGFDVVHRGDKLTIAHRRSTRAN